MPRIDNEPTLTYPEKILFIACVALVVLVFLLFYTGIARADQKHTLTWINPPSDETHSPPTTIEIHRRASNTPRYGFLTTTPPTTTTIVLALPGTAPSDRHCYKIRAVNAAGPSAFTDEACTTIPSPAQDTFIPHAPHTLTATINAPTP
jgi:hypothetical protein